jgi:Yip1 domain/zinc-ribbon domain
VLFPVLKGNTLQEKSAMFCPQCGKAVAIDSRFCGKCGQPIATGGSRSQSGTGTGGTGGTGGDFGMAAAAAPGMGASGLGMETSGVGMGGSGLGIGTSGSGTGAPGPGFGATGPQALPGLVERIKSILLTPKTEWPVIAAEATSISQLYSGYVAPMAGFAAVMSFIRMSVVGVSLPFGGTIRTPMLSGLMSAVVTFVLGLIGLFLVGLIINMLAPTFSGVRDQRQALKTAAYALTPAWLGTALSFLPMGPLLQLLAGVYGIYVLYLGLPVMMQGKQQNAAGYTATVVACTFLLGILFGVVGAALGGAAHMGAQPH